MKIETIRQLWLFAIYACLWFNAAWVVQRTINQDSIWYGLILIFMIMPCIFISTWLSKKII